MENFLRKMNIRLVVCKTWDEKHRNALRFSLRNQRKSGELLFNIFLYIISAFSLGGNSIQCFFESKTNITLICLTLPLAGCGKYCKGSG